MMHEVSLVTPSKTSINEKNSQNKTISKNLYEYQNTSLPIEPLNNYDRLNSKTTFKK